MTVLIDTDVLVSFISVRERDHTAAVAIMKAALAGRWGTPYTTDYIIDESLTLLMARRARLDAADRLLALVLPRGPSSPVPILPMRVSDAAFSESIRLFRRHFDRGLSFTDCTTLSVASERRVPQVASFDGGFDGLLNRVPPPL